MKRKIFVGLLFLEALVCILLQLISFSFTGIFTTAMAFPFEQLGLALRTLSLSGHWGNITALALYLIIGLLPAVYYLILRIKHKSNSEDKLLFLLCAALFAVLYFMINPGLLSPPADTAAGMAVIKAALGIMVYSVLLGYLILKALRLFSSKDSKNLERYMGIMLGVLNAIFIYLAFGSCLGLLLESIRSLQTGNIGNENLSGISYAFLILQYLINILPYIFDILIVFAALRLLTEMRKDRYAMKTVLAAEHMSGLCITALKIITLSNITFQLLQLLFAKTLRVLNTTVQLPLFSLLFGLSAILLTRFITETKELKNENDQFI